ncbi:ribulose 1,5-bisphosphate carboxylase large subunit [Rhodococcus sp. 1168]|uniref:ribulose 1,5-bisphosphate carboxylase large subunit n=1 Tax=Rhodococcus sp. 1168 TaxID=2018041 RepID=UPI000A0E6317|nr:ribulose 1,5-bisphosphate carboxylase large subunit [Rhodococcus sp. 1168]ORI18141.1 ribulose 1,5-bisphosphate carboxylase large subunit [Rhodococcus sp. 1168]
MALVLAGVRLPVPFGGLTAAKFGRDVALSSTRWARDTANFAWELPSRVETLLDEVTTLMARIDEVVTAAQLVVIEAAVTTRSAEGVVDTASKTSAAAFELVELFEPMAQQAAPFAQKFVDHLSEQEVDATIAMVDQLPEIVEHMKAVLPILATLDTVSPEIHELLNVTKDVRRAVIGIPGFKFLRKRGEEKLAEEAEEEGH